MSGKVVYPLELLPRSILLLLCCSKIAVCCFLKTRVWSTGLRRCPARFLGVCRQLQGLFIKRPALVSPPSDRALQDVVGASKGFFIRPFHATLSTPASVLVFRRKYCYPAACIKRVMRHPWWFLWVLDAVAHARLALPALAVVSRWNFCHSAALRLRIMRRLWWF